MGETGDTNSLVERANKLFQTALKKAGEGYIVAPFLLRRAGDKTEKRPLLERGALERWLKNGQTISEVENLRWTEANAIGIFLAEIKTPEGPLYPCAIDIDGPEDFWRPLLKHLKTTYFEKSLRGGLHALYLSKQPVVKPKSISLENNCKVEFLTNKWLIIHPSECYTRLNDNAPRVIENGLEVFIEFLRNAGLLEKMSAPALKESGEKGDGARLRLYLEKVENVLRPYLAYEGYNYVLYHCPFHQPDKHPSFYLNKEKFYLHDFHDGRSYSLRDFLRAINGEKEGRGEGAVKSELTIWPLSAVLERAGEVNYISAPLLPRGALILLYGPPGCGKSFLTLDIALRVSRGERILGYFDAEQGSVLIVDLESPLNLLKQRWAFLGGGENKNVFILNDFSFNLTSKSGFEVLKKAIDEYNLSLITIDNLSSINPKLNENDSIKMYCLLSRLRQICLEKGVTIVLVHHVRKSQMFSFSPLDEVRGSSALTAVPDLILSMSKVQTFYQLRVVKNRVSNDFPNMLLEIDAQGFKYLQETAETFDAEVSQLMRVVEEIGGQSPGGVFSINQIHEAVPYKKKAVYQAIQIMHAIGRVKRVRRGVYQLVTQSSLTDWSG